MVKIDDIYCQKVSTLKLKDKDGKLKQKNGKKKANVCLRAFLEADVIDGSGKIVSSQTTVQGLLTSFLDELNIGDVITVRNAHSLVYEERIVVDITSQRVLHVSSKFVPDIISTSDFKIRKESTVIEQLAIEKVSLMDLGEDPEGKIASLRILEEKNRILFERIESQTKSIEVREENGLIKGECVGNHKTEEELLDLRSKRKSDKYCW